MQVFRHEERNEFKSDQEMIELSIKGKPLEECIREIEDVVQELSKTSNNLVDQITN